jgi:hypothetical protein
MSRPRRSESVLTAEHLRRVLLYDPHTGLWKWKQGGKGRPKEPDWWPGTVTSQRKYLSVSVGRLAYYAHRLAFLYMTGEWPKEQVDHIDGDRSNNRWANLREATGSQNKYNTGRRGHNTSGFRGVYHHRDGGWIARIKIGEKRVSLGYFATPEEASRAYEAAAQEHFGEYYRRLQ